ncbi:MAG: response regulator transcription factor [Ignavibacteriales bacterium]|nr:response regulator transcription factor [Ignavibacteriales bacterium]
MTEHEIKVIIIEDHKSFREGLEILINSSSEFQCIAAFESVESALGNLPAGDVLLLDIHLTGMSGIAAIPKIREIQPALKIIMMTVFDSDDSIFTAILAGADGYLLKKTPPQKILYAVADVMQGGSPMSPYVAKRVLEHFKTMLPKPAGDYKLTTRESEILTELVDGLDSKQIAGKLFISYETVRNHLKHIYEKLHVCSRSQAVSKALQEGLTK